MVSPMINKIYLSEKTISRVREELRKKTFVLLDDFFEREICKELTDDLKKRKFKHFRVVDEFSFSFSKINKKIVKFFANENFLGFLQKISGKKVKSLSLDARKFQHIDYTLIKNSLEKEKGFIFLFFVCDNWRKEFGGNKIFSINGENIIFTPMGNSIVFLNLNKKTKSFYQYVNSLSKRKEFFVIEGRINFKRF